MNGDQDPLQGTLQEREDYVKQVFAMIEQDVEQRKAQRLAEFQKSRESKAVLVGGIGAEGSVVRSLGDQSNG